MGVFWTGAAYRIALVQAALSANGTIKNGRAVRVRRAERAGFEPAKVLPLLAFQASALGHYATSPR